MAQLTMRRAVPPHHSLGGHYGWFIERVFQQITEVFPLKALIASTPQGTLFQLSFCLLLYNRIQLLRSYVAQGQQRPTEPISAELLFEDVAKQLV